MRDLLRRMFTDVLRELDVGRRMKARLSAHGTVLEIDNDLYALDQYREIRVIAFGKAAAEMAATLDETLGAGRARGLVVTSAPATALRPNFEYITGGHPYPNQNSLRAAEHALSIAHSAGEQTLLIFLISGGGSAILEKSLFDDVTIEDLAEFNRVLVTCGANIYEMNVLRKHFSAIKGGRLAVAGWPARQITVYVSDVPADKPSTVASGPTMPDESTVQDCLEVARQYGLLNRLPEAYASRLSGGQLPETPKPGEPHFAHSEWYAVLSNQDGIEALRARAEAQGWRCETDLSCDDWPLPMAADHLLERLRSLRQAARGPACVVSGGELSSPVTGDGIGGRNLAFALHCAMRIAGLPVAVLSAGTDGVDGNSPAAGAVADGTTVARARALGLDPADYFQRSDSYSFFAAVNDALITGPTGNNVRDLRILVAT